MVDARRCRLRRCAQLRGNRQDPEDGIAPSLRRPLFVTPEVDGVRARKSPHDRLSRHAVRHPRSFFRRPPACASSVSPACRAVALGGRRARAGTRVGMDFLGLKRLAAFGAHHHGIEDLSALAMLMQQRPAALVDHMGIAPMHHRHHDRIEIEALLGEDVFMPLGRLLVGDAAQHALPDQLLQPFGEQMPRDAERRLKSLEPPRAQKAFAQDQKASSDRRSRRWCGPANTALPQGHPTSFLLSSPHGSQRARIGQGTEPISHSK